MNTQIKDTKMAHPVGFYSLSHNNALIKDMCETWGEGLEKMSESDTLWLIARIAHEAWLECDSSTAPSNEAESAWKRLHELKQWEKFALISAMAQ
ncbi:hypothetical protein [aff. Roholtiella sp. LEGE 12411]|uniref:hypothetical protein n=1 Tax=aff. Roholtiella sp. LEGE 12411 TaxID=1828822 RepID=UPI00187FC922|nr:hypothetical protein [aff. Roholtiella sp. LEGE 12411]MBE9036961.1 hypothetical protein [aff. Roholtiella sp. LEGE 12411]